MIGEAGILHVVDDPLWHGLVDSYLLRTRHRVIDRAWALGGGNKKLRAIQRGELVVNTLLLDNDLGGAGTRGAHALKLAKGAHDLELECKIVVYFSYEAPDSDLFDGYVNKSKIGQLPDVLDSLHKV